MNWITLGILLILTFDSFDLIKTAHLRKSKRHHNEYGGSSSSNDDETDYGNNNNDEQKTAAPRKKSKLSAAPEENGEISDDAWIYDSDANNKVDPDGGVIHLPGSAGTRQGRRRSRQHHHHHHLYHNGHHEEENQPATTTTSTTTTTTAGPIDIDVSPNHRLTAFLVDDTRIIEPGNEAEDDDDSPPSTYKLLDDEWQSDFNHNKGDGSNNGDDEGEESEYDDDDDENNGSGSSKNENLQKLMKVASANAREKAAKNKLSDNGWRLSGDDNKLLHKGEGVGDMSCMQGDDFIPAPQIGNADVKYLRNDEQGEANSYLEAEYHCHVGYKLEQASLNSNFSSYGEGRQSKHRQTGETKRVPGTQNLICQNKKWHGLVPRCEKLHHRRNVDKLCSINNRCDQICLLRGSENNKTEQCSCFKGFKMVANACVDLNECQANNCEHSCTNTLGSYRCKCKQGFQLSGRHRCKDVNECSSHNGHGPCQDKCINLVGSYKCTCDGLPSTRLAADGHTCENVVDCSENNGGCSHSCIETLGSPFCTCPRNFILGDDWKTCIKLNSDRAVNIESICPKGYYFNYTYDECEDIDECAAQNGGCQDLCTNTEGSFYCSCQMGFIFGPDNRTCVELSNVTLEVTCPPLIPPDHGYLECSTNKHHIANWPGSQCVLRCPNGFRVIGRYSKICGNDGKWLGSGDGACIRYPKPKLICPKDIVVETPPRDSRVVMPLPKPVTDVSWDRDIAVTPNYVKDLNLVLSSGVENITYTATHPLSRLSVSCSFSVTVLDGHAPTVKFCPETQKYTVAKHQDTIKVSWIEPIFADNINVTSVTKSNVPGNRLGMGTHLITYEAKDAAGFVARCTFKIIINGSRRQVLPLLYSKFYYL